MTNLPNTKAGFKKSKTPALIFLGAIVWALWPAIQMCVIDNEGYHEIIDLVPYSDRVFPEKETRQ